jgi:hypothetical protein
MTFLGGFVTGFVSAIALGLVFYVTLQRADGYKTF